MRQQRTDPAAIEAEIARIKSLALDALRRRWRAVFGRTPPAALSKDLLGRMIAWRVTVSGISAGAFFAHQFHVAYSGLVKGAGLVAGGPYACAEQVDAIDPPFGNPLILGLIPRRIVAALAVCTHFARSDFKQAGWNFPAKPDPNESRKTALRAHAQGRIDDPVNL